MDKQTRDEILSHVAYYLDMTEDEDTIDCDYIKGGKIMDKIDWKRKLTSRKLWLSVASFVAMLLIAFNVPDGTAQQVSALIMAGATVIGYVIGEGLADAGNKE